MVLRWLRALRFLAGTAAAPRPTGALRASAACASRGLRATMAMRESAELEAALQRSAEAAARGEPGGGAGLSPEPSPLQPQPGRQEVVVAPHAGNGEERPGANGGRAASGLAQLSCLGTSSAG